MIFGVGVDIIQIPRIEKILERQKLRFVRTVYTEKEKEYCFSKFNPAFHFASRYAAKEAFLKAIGIGMREKMAWHDIEIVKDSLGKPGISLSGYVHELLLEQVKKKNMSLYQVDLSISDDYPVAIAFVAVSFV